MKTSTADIKTNRAGIAAWAVSVALGLTGCSGDSRAADPKVATPAGSTATSPPSPAPTTAAPPTQSSTRALEGAAAIAVVQKHVAEFNEALKSGSTTAFRATFKESCALCLGDARTFDEYTRNNQKIAGGAYTLIAPKAIRMSSGQFLVQAELSQAAARILDNDGHTLKEFRAVRFGITWTTKPSSGGTFIIVDSVPS